MARALASNALTLAIAMLLALAAFLAWAERSFHGPGPLAAAICLEVPPGASVARVSRDLQTAGALNDARLFRLGAAYSGRAGDLKAGSFLVPEGASMALILDTVTGSGFSTCGEELNYQIGVRRAVLSLRALDPATGRYGEILAHETGPTPPPPQLAAAMADPGTRLRVTLAEGVTSWQVVEALRRFDPLTGEIADLPPEGSLAPDSYELRAGQDRAALLAEMSARQSRILAQLWDERAPDLPLATPQEALILASIIEKETGIGEERPTVASVFVNRLRSGMPLQTDPTVIYGVTEGRGVLDRGLRRSELARETPWNTYVIRGLPPTPIANPGRASIAAALNPATTDYLFFVADGTGGHAFATTLAEHNRNVAAWRRIERQQAAD